MLKDVRYGAAKFVMASACELGGTILIDALEKRVKFNLRRVEKEFHNGINAAVRRKNVITTRPQSFSTIIKDGKLVGWENLHSVNPDVIAIKGKSFWLLPEPDAPSQTGIPREGSVTNGDRIAFIREEFGGSPFTIDTASAMYQLKFGLSSKAEFSKNFHSASLPLFRNESLKSIGKTHKGFDIFQLSECTALTPQHKVLAEVIRKCLEGSTQSMHKEEKDFTC
jgi:hypothetical protein